MLEFKTIEELKPNPSIIDTIKSYTYKTINGKVKVLKNTNLIFIKPTEYLITYPLILTIYEYKIQEKQERNRKLNLFNKTKNFDYKNDDELEKKNDDL